MIPISGSAYTYAYATLGELVAWIIGWDLMLEYAIGNVAVAIAWSDYFTSLLRVFGLEIPYWLTTSYRNVAISYPGPAGRAAAALRPPHRDQRARHLHHRRHHLGAGHRHPGEQPGQQRDRGAEAGRARALRGGGLLLRRSRQLARLSRPTAGRASTRARPSCSSPSSASTPSPPRPRRPRTRSATCPSASWARWPSAPSSTSWSALVATGLVPYTELQGLGPAGPRLRAARRALDALHPGPGRGHLHDRGAARLPARADAHLLLDEPGRPAAHLVPPHPPALRHALRDHDLDGRHRGRLSSILDDDETYDLTNIGTLFAFLVVCLGVLALRIKEPDRPRPFRVPAVWVVAPLGARRPAST